MPRVANVNIPDNKPTWVALTHIYGIGPSRALKITKATKIDPQRRAKELSGEELRKIQDFIQKNYPVEGALRDRIRQDIKRLKDTKSYRGTRHIRGLPARGQKTKTNSRTVRGNVRRTVATGRKAPPPVK